MSEPDLPPVPGYREMLESLHEAVYYTDASRRIRFWNRAATELTGFSADEILGQSCGSDLLQHTDEDGRQLCLHGCPLAQTLADGERRAERLYLHHRDGHRVPVLVRVAPVRDSDGRIVGAVETFTEEESAEALRRRIAELETQALLDPLTGIPNRRWLAQQLDARMDEYRRYRWPFGVLLLDLDLFKSVNDTHGHDVGDRLLRAVARSLAAGARPSDSVGRWGGEEFLAVVANVDLEQLLRIGERLRALVATSVLREPNGVGVTCSIGAAVVRPEDSIEAVLRRADLALYRAKHEGRNRAVA